jgi:PAS domain S-box-containing protein
MRRCESQYLEEEGGVSPSEGVARETVMKTNNQLLQEVEDLRKRLKETEGALQDLQNREEMLRKSEQEKTAILNSIHEAITYLDADMRVLWANSAATGSVGLTPGQIVGRHCYEVWCKSVKPHIDCPAVRTMKTGQTEKGEISTPDGKTWLHHSYPAYDPSGHIVKIVITTLDITERKRAEELLKRSEQAYRTLAENLPGMVYRIFIRENNRMEFFNTMLQPMTGYTAEELIAGEVCSIEPLILTQDRQAVVTIVKRAILDHQPFEVEYRLRHKEGETRFFLERGRPIYGEDGRPLYIDGVILDITKRKQMEELLRTSNEELERRVQERTGKLSEANQDLQKKTELLERLFSITNFMLAYIDKDFNFLRVNRALAEDDGRAPEFFIGKNLFNLFPSLDQEDFRKVMETGEPASGCGNPFMHPEHPERGTTYWDWHFQAVKEPDSKVAGMVLGFVDVTERKHAEEALRESEKRLRFLSSQLITAQEQERKRIASELHEGLGALLSGIKYKVEVALQQRANNKSKAVEKQLESVIPMIQESIEEVRRIQTDLRPATLDSLGLLATLRSISRKFQTTYPSISVQEQIDIKETEIPASLKIVIYRISQEALNNVAKHSKADLAHLSVRKRDGKIELVIQDNGQGFDVTEALSRGSPEQGLGLTSMRERAELSGGSFAIESIIGKGTTIRASWP